MSNQTTNRVASPCLPPEGHDRDLLTALIRIVEAHDAWVAETGFEGPDDPLTDAIEAARPLIIPSAGRA